MYDSNFHIEKIRFHLIDKKKLIIVGWFKQDNKDNREIRVTADDVRHVETKIIMTEDKMFREKNYYKKCMTRLADKLMKYKMK